MAELTEEQKARRTSLIHSRGQIKSRITKLTNYLKSSGVWADASHINRHLQKIEELLRNLPNIEQELVTIEPNGNHAEESENIHFDVEEMMVLIRKFREPHREFSQLPRSFTAMSHASPTDYLASLPKVEAKRFDGKLENWRSYRDWFVQTIHSRDGLTDAQRLDYLKRTLMGEAESTINAFQATDDNYAVAWKLLESTYDNEYVLIFRHCELLMDAPPMKKNSPEEIRKFINQIQTQILAMKALGERVEEWNTLLSYIILRKLDRDTEREWNRTRKGNKIPKYEDILTFLREQATLLTCTRPSWGSSNSNQASHSQAKSKNEGSGYQRAQTHLTAAGDDTCPLCDEEHTIDTCEKFLILSTPDRIAAARKHRLCLNCFGKNHKTRFCKLTQCSKCQKRHNTLVHLTEEELAMTQAPSA